MKNLDSISVPKNWYFGIEPYVSYHKLSNFQPNFNRYIEKQLVITEGIYLIIPNNSIYNKKYV